MITVEDSRWKHSRWNSNKYVVTCLRENNDFLSFYNLITVKAKQFNILV